MKTYSARPEDVKRDWYVVDASDKVLGRLASAIAHRLRQHKPIYTPHVDTGDFIVVTNVEIKVTGNKAEDKLYHRHSGVRAASARRRSADAAALSGRVLEKAVWDAAEGPLATRCSKAQMLRRRRASARGPTTKTLDPCTIGSYYCGTGRRKSAVARVFIKQGSGKFIVNDKPVDEFSRAKRAHGRPPAAEAGQSRGDVRSWSTSRRRRIGPGGAVRHGITRALIDYDAQLKPPLSKRARSGTPARSSGRRSACTRRDVASSFPALARHTANKPAAARRPAFGLRRGLLMSYNGAGMVESRRFDEAA
jgi:large subunit ribosomal protein L13